MLEKVKLALRYRNNLFDDEISMYIQACRNDLTRGGVLDTKFNEHDEAIVSCVICYCKSQLDYQGKGDRYENIYNKMRLGLILDKRYTRE